MVVVGSSFAADKSSEVDRRLLEVKRFEPVAGSGVLESSEISMVGLESVGSELWNTQAWLKASLCLQDCAVTKHAVVCYLRVTEVWLLADRAFELELFVGFVADGSTKKLLGVNPG